MEEQSLKNSTLYERRFGKKGGISVFYLILTLFVICTLCFRIYWTTNYFCVTVDGDSMVPTLQTGEKLLVKYGEKAERGDIIIVDVKSYKTDPEKRKLVENPFDEDTNYLIKRLIAIEGDTVKCTGGTVYIRYAGQEYADGEWDIHPSDQYIRDGKNDDFGVYEVGEGEIFFLGDNRLISRDSRYKEDSKPHLKQLYKVEDIYGVVPDWAYENRGWLAKFPILG